MESQFNDRDEIANFKRGPIDTVAPSSMGNSSVEGFDLRLNFRSIELSQIASRPFCNNQLSSQFPQFLWVNTLESIDGYVVLCCITGVKKLRK